MMLAGCVTATPEEQMQARMAKANALLAAATNVCTTNGFKPNTPEMTTCANNLAISQAQQEQVDEAAHQRRSAGLIGLGAAMMGGNPPSVSCYSRPSLLGTRTVCN